MANDRLKEPVMSIFGLNHYTIRCIPADLPAIRDFYTKYLQLEAGERPSMPRPGFWLYNEGQPIVHLYASLEERVSGPTGALDHISFRARELERTRTFLQKDGVAFDELPLPGTRIHQIFLRDPMGLKIELTFDLDEEQSHA
jgi:catechol 2,3-dioxygenase-like lactoylglutathione lyase family enzyme